MMRKSVIAVSVSSALLGLGVANAEEIELDTLQIEDRANDINPYTQDGAPYKARVSGDSRRVEELADTPQTITVITQEEIQDSGNTDLKQILADQPGVTIGTGENGNAFGDRYIIRGHEARSDVFVDGLKDPGMTTRESFAVDQIEITKGPSATFAGRGSTGGAVNSVTKQATTEYDFTNGQVTLGTYKYNRTTVDSNILLGDDMAVRLNALYSDTDVPNRGPAARERKGLAVSFTKEISDATKLIADVYYLKAEDKPDLGTYIVRDGSPVKNVPVYLQNSDFLDSEVMSGTFRIKHAFTDSVRLENATRYGTTDNGYVVTGTRGGDANRASIQLSSHQGWQDVEYFVNQTNLFIDSDIGSTKHQFIVGLEYSDLNVVNGTYDVNDTTPNCGTRVCITDANGNVFDNLGSIAGRTISKEGKDSDYSIKTISAYLMDTADLTDKFTLSGGIRADRYDYQNDVGSTTVTEYKNSDTLWNGNAGALYKINDDINVYASYGTATNINGGESDLGANCGYGGLCADAGTAGSLSDSKPERTRNLELGTKWNLMNDKLLLTAAVFQITKYDVFEGVPRGSSYTNLGMINTGENRVEGVELGLVGNVTDKLSMSAGVAMMDSEVLKSSDPSNEGKRLANFADNSARAQLRYQLTPKFAFGAVATYSSEMYAGQPDTAAGDNIKIPSYTYYDMFATYQFTPKLRAQLNINNVTDKDYYLASYRSGAFTYIGDARNANLSLSYKF
ncbi:MAG: TonB-dependent receptor [Methylophilaceae bacterium]